MVVLIFGMLFFKDELSKSTVVPLRCLPCSIFTDSLLLDFLQTVLDNCSTQALHGWQVIRPGSTGLRSLLQKVPKTALPDMKTDFPFMCSFRSEPKHADLIAIKCAAIISSGSFYQMHMQVCFMLINARKPLIIGMAKISL